MSVIFVIARAIITLVRVIRLLMCEIRLINIIRFSFSFFKSVNSVNNGGYKKSCKTKSQQNEKTLNENIADLCGLNIAYDAFLLSQDGQDKHPVDGFTDKQRFFISYAQIWREVFQEETLIQSLSGWHAAPQYRTNGVVYNIDGFYKAFDISPNSERYRSKEQRIMIW